jgi:hypothetical protein
LSARHLTATALLDGAFGDERHRAVPIRAD